MPDDRDTRILWLFAGLWTAFGFGVGVLFAVACYGLDGR